MLENNSFEHDGCPDQPEHSPESALGQVAAEILRQRLRPSELAKAGGSTPAWHWHGYLGAGKMTLLTSQWKSGKTTLVSILLKRMATGGELAGLPVTAGRAAVFTEESSKDWEVRHQKLQLQDHVSLFCRPFSAKPTTIQWRGIIEAMLHEQRHEGLELLVIDPLSVFLPGNSENMAGPMVDCLLPLRELTDRGLSVLLVHHPRKGTCLPGQAARGSGALPSHVDIVVEMNWHGQPEEANRRRWLRAHSRHDETRRNLILELAAAGDDYRVHDMLHDEAGAENWNVLCLVLQDASERLTQRQILEQWPEDFPKPERTTMVRTLARGVEQGQILRQGTGRKNDPYHYWLPGKEEDFFPGPNASPEEKQRWQHRWRTKWFKSQGIDGSAARETPAGAADPAGAGSKAVTTAAAADPAGADPKSVTTAAASETSQAGSAPLALEQPADSAEAPVADDPAEQPATERAAPSAASPQPEPPRGKGKSH